MKQWNKVAELVEVILRYDLGIGVELGEATRLLLEGKDAGELIKKVRGDLERLMMVRSGTAFGNLMRCEGARELKLRWIEPLGMLERTQLLVDTEKYLELNVCCCPADEHECCPLCQRLCEENI